MQALRKKDPALLRLVLSGIGYGKRTMAPSKAPIQRTDVLKGRARFSAWPFATAYLSRVLIHARRTIRGEPDELAGITFGSLTVILPLPGSCGGNRRVKSAFSRRDPACHRGVNAGGNAMSNYRLISADSHFVEPPNMWAERVDKRF